MPQTIRVPLSEVEDQLRVPLSDIAGQLEGGDVDEGAFRRWYGGHATRLGLNPDPDDPQHFYDYRAAFQAGAGPDETGHWPSQFKREGHPRMVVDGVNTKTGERVEPSTVPLHPYARLGQGVLDVGRRIVDQVATAGKSSAEHLREGNLPAAFHDIAAPVVDVFNPGALFANRPTREQATEQAIELATGAPVAEMKQALADRDPLRFVGQVAGTGALLLAPRAAQGGLQKIRGLRLRTPATDPVAQVAVPAAVDPNFAGGAGNPELAGSQPYPHAKPSAIRVTEPTRIGPTPESVRVPLAELAGQLEPASPKPAAPAADLSPAEQRYQTARAEAMEQGYTGTDAQLRMEFNRRLEQARALSADQQDTLQDVGPKALLQAIADAGGLNVQHDLYGGELAGLAENSRSFAVGSGTAKTGGVKSSHAMPTMELGGVGGVLRNGVGHSPDGMVEALRQDPRFAPFIENPRDLFAAIEDAARMAPVAEAADLDAALGAAGVRPGNRWWEDPGAVSARGVETLRVPVHELPELSDASVPAARPLSSAQRGDDAFLSRLPSDLQPTLRKVWEEYGAFEDQRRGVQPLERTQALANRVELPESVSAGQAFNAEQMGAAYDRLIAKEREYQTLNTKVQTRQPLTDAEWVRHRELDVERVLAAERSAGRWPSPAVRCGRFAPRWKNSGHCRRCSNPMIRRSSARRPRRSSMAGCSVSTSTAIWCLASRRTNET
jgi:hypothetical protein